MAKIWERYHNSGEVDRALEADAAIMSVCWARIDWLYMDDVPGESRLDFLRRAEKLRILKSCGYKELAKLERAARNSHA